jgi:dTDP-4-dehydrorhamnose reductase
LSHGTILVTGASGMLGGEVVERLSREHRVVATDLDTLDITDPRQIARRLDEDQPRCVINCAGMTNVDACERDPDAAMRQNAQGPRLLAEACDARAIGIIHISTDYVFDGAKGAPYDENDAPNPINAYGQSKLDGERAVQAACARHKILRVSMLYGMRRTNFADFVARCIETGQPVRALTDNAGSPSHCRDLAEQIAVLIDHPATGMFHCAGLGGCTRLEFAERIRALWPAPDLVIQPVTQDQFPQMIARRPRNTALDCGRLRELGLLRLRPWQEAVAAYLAERRELAGHPP